MPSAQDKLSREIRKSMTHKLVGRYIVTDPNVCHGKPTFRGTRIMVSQVLDQVARGMPEPPLARLRDLSAR